MISGQLASLLVNIDAKLGPLQAQLDQAVGKTRVAGSQIERETGRVTKAFGGIKTAVAGVAGAIAALGALSVVRSLGNIADAASNAERQFARIDGVIAATGGAAGRTTQEVERLAQEIGRSTLASTQAVRDAAGVLLTFRNVAGDTFDTTLRLAQDLAEAGFGSVESAALQLGKALNDPVLGLSALSRSGVTFTEQQREQVKSLVATNDLLGAQAVIIEEVSRQVGGVGVAAAQGYAGALDTAGEEVKLLTEALGARLLPSLTNVQNTIASVARFLTENLDAALQAGSDAALALGTALTVTLSPALFAATRAVAAFTLSLATNPVVLFTAAVAGLAFVYRDELRAAINVALEVGEAFLEWVGDIFRALGPFIDRIVSGAKVVLDVAASFVLAASAATGLDRALRSFTASGRLTEFERLEAQISDLSGQFSELNGLIERGERQGLGEGFLGPLRDQLGVVATELFDARTALDSLGAEIEEDLEPNFLDNALASITQLRDSLGGLIDGGGGGSGGGGGRKGSVKEAKNALDSLNLTYLDTKTFIGGAVSALSTYGLATGEVTAEQAKLNGAISDFNADPMVDALADVENALRSTFEQGLNDALGSLLGFENEFTRIISRLVTRLAEQQFDINIGLSGNGSGSVRGGGGNDLLGQLQDLPVSDLIGSIFGGAASGVSSFAGFSTAAAANSFGNIAASGLAFDAAAPLVASAPVAGSAGGSLLGGAAGGLFSAGAGVLGSFIGSRLFDQNSPLLGSIGSGVGAIGGGLAGGAIAGAAAGSIVPGIGTAIGALIGAILGSAAGMIGGPPSGEQQAALFSGASGEFQSFSGRTGKNFSQENQDAARSIGEAASALLVTLNAVTGTASAFRDVEGDVSNRDGALLRLSGNDDGLQTAAQLLEEDDIAATVVQAFLDATKDLKPEYDAIFRSLLEPSDDLLRTVAGADLRDTAGNIDVERLERALDLIASINGATEALKDLGPTEFIGPVEAFYRSVKDEVARVRALNEEFGADISAVEELGAKAIAEFNAGFIQSLEDEVRALQGKPYLPAARQIIESTQRALDDAAQEGLTDALPLLSERFSLQFGQAIEDIDLSGLTEIRDFIMELEEPSDTSAQAIDILNEAIASLSVVAEEVAEDFNRALLPAIQGTATGLEFVDGVWRQVQRNFDLRGDIAAGLNGGGNVVPLRAISEGLAQRTQAANTNAAPDLQLRQITDGFAQLFLTIRSGVSGVNAEILRSTDRTIAALSSAFEQQIAGLTALGAEFGRAAGQAGSIIASLATDSTNPQTAFETLRGQFDSFAAGARSGSPGGVDAFAGFQGDFLSAAREFFPEGTGEFFQQVEDVRAVALEAGANARARERDVASQIRALQSQQQAEADRLAELAERQIIENGARAEAQIAKLAELEQVLIRSAEQDRALLLAVIDVLNKDRETTEVGNATLRDLRRLLSEANDRPIIVRVA